MIQSASEEKRGRITLLLFSGMDILAGLLSIGMLLRENAELEVSKKDLARLIIVSNLVLGGLVYLSTILATV